jgi:predicted DNA-binding protein with PD1-like motif
MEYSVGKIGRCVVINLADNEDVYANIQKVAEKESVTSAVVLAVGGIKRAKVVVGPKDPNGKIEPVFREFDDAREILGVGTIFPDENGPKLHFHSAFGRGDTTLVGCPRGGANVYCTLEIIIIELTDVGAVRALDPKLGVKLLSLLNPAP